MINFISDIKRNQQNNIMRDAKFYLLAEGFIFIAAMSCIEQHGDKLADIYWEKNRIKARDIK